MRAVMQRCFVGVVLVSAWVAGAQPLRPSMFEPAFFPFVQDDPAPPRIEGPIDTRFFGTFCQPSPISGTLNPVVNFHPQAEGYYRVILKVTDQGAVVSVDSIDVWTQRHQID